MSRVLREIRELAKAAQCDMNDILKYGDRNKTEEEQEALKSVQIKIRAILRYIREALAQEANDES